MKKILICLILAVTLLFSSDAFARMSFMRVESPAEQVFFSTVRIETEKVDEKGNPTTEVATGFVVSYKWGRNRFGEFLVTNKHAIERAVKGRFYFLKGQNGRPVLGQTYNIEMDNFENRWFKNPDPGIDIAVFPLGEILLEIKKRNWQIYYKAITPAISLDPMKASRLDAIEQVIFVGYPSGLVDTTTYLPVARRGITATPLTIDYAGLPQFLIDASVFPGSSGSPVFILNTGSYTDRRGNLVLGNRVIFLGIIANIFIRKETSALVFDGSPAEGVPALRTQQMIDIATVFKASAIFSTIEDMIKSREAVKQ